MDENLSSDPVSSMTKRATEVLFATEARAVCFGVLLGRVLIMLVKVSRPILQTLPLDFSSLTSDDFLLLGVFISIVIARCHHQALPQSIQQAFVIIREGERMGKITKRQAKQTYRAILNQIIVSIKLDQKTHEQ